MTAPDKSRRLLITALGALGAAQLTGCASGGRISAAAVLGDALGLIRGSNDAYPLTDDEILANPGAQLGVRVENHGPGVFQLIGEGTPGAYEHQWLIGGPILLATHYGRICSTRGFVPELTGLQMHGEDPLIRICRGENARYAHALQSVRFARRSTEHAAEYDEQIAVLRPRGDMGVTVLGREYSCEVWHETVITKTADQRHENTFYVHKASGHILQSFQKPFHDSPLIRTELLKAPGPGPRA